MALTSDEIQSIVNSVLSSLATNSKTIADLTPVTTLSDTDYFEIGGGKKVSYSVLSTLIAGLSSSSTSGLQSQITKNVLKSVSFDVGESTATLTIQQNGHTVSASVPIATDSKAGLITAADKVKIQAAKDAADTAKTTAEAASTKASVAQATAVTAQNVSATANATANTAKTAAETAQAAATAAQTTANLAKANAATAQTTADLAKTNAATAQAKADSVETALNSEKTATAGRFAGVGIFPIEGEAGSTAHSSGVYLKAATDTDNAKFATYGTTDWHGFKESAYNTDDGARTDVVFRKGTELYKVVDGKLIKVGGNAIGNVYNVTNERPLASGKYYNDINDETQTYDALAAVWAAGMATLGMQITFAINASTWKIYQYVGANVEEETEFTDTDNWVDLAGQSAGKEPMLNVDLLVPRTTAGYYDKSTAVNAVMTFCTTSGIDYKKCGLVITFRSGQYEWKAYQFQGADVADFSNADLWKEFGGAGGSVQTSSDIVENGTDALSTGGAYTALKGVVAKIEELENPDDTDNTYYQAYNKYDEALGDPIKVPVSGGGGTASGTSLFIYLENPAVAGAVGSELIAKAAIRSVTTEGSATSLNTIVNVKIVDPVTGLTLFSDDVNKISSASATNYTFEFDFTPYFSGAGVRQFTIVAKDSEGNTRNKTVTVTAVDATCVACNEITYKATSALVKGGSSKFISMYRFPNNVSKQGIKAVVEMYYDDEWKKLGEATVTNTFIQQVTIDPMNVFGGDEELAHGAYPIRVQGEDIASGVKGNTIYTSVMCVDADSSTPIVAVRYDDKNNGKIKLYETFSLEVAAYTPDKETTTAEVYIDGTLVSSLGCKAGETYTVSKALSGYPTDGTKTISAYAKATVGSVVKQSNTISVTIEGSAIAAAIKSGELFSYDFSTRSNDESDHTITSHGYEMTVEGANWTTNGFKEFLGEKCLRIAENVKATIPWKMFQSPTANGVAFQMVFATKNIKDPDAKLCSCYDSATGAGFYVCGNKVVLTCNGGAPGSVEREFQCGERHTLAVVVEPSSSNTVHDNVTYSTLRMYVDGDEIGTIGYNIANAIAQISDVKFDGTDGDLYLYYAMGYDTSMERVQAFQNHVCKLPSTAKMMEEYNANDVLNEQGVPTIEGVKKMGMPYYVIVAPQTTFNAFDGDIDTGTNFECTLFYYDPVSPWKSFKAEHVRWRRQGTTSAKRSVKNDRFYLRKNEGWAVTPLNPDYTTAEAQRAYDLMEKGYVQVGENTIPVCILTVKVDWSDSTMANDCGVCDLMNATYRALGDDYMTPAQKAFDGTWVKSGVTVTGLQMNHSTANHPVAAFRATQESLTDAWFHARGNWKEDKGEQVALGFQDTPGYNKGCLNYGDFVEYFGQRTDDSDGKFSSQETLDQIETRFKADTSVDTSKVYILSQYCGRNYRVMRHNGTQWASSNGSMKKENGKWVISGDVLNPVCGFELLQYNQMDWFQGVASIDDMMEATTSEASWVTKLKNSGKLTATSFPKWTLYFECMIDDDQLQVDLALGKKVPYELYSLLKFCASCDYSDEDLADTWSGIWKAGAWKHMNVKSLIAYYAFTDYLAAVDQQAKNMQPMWFLDENGSVTNGVYASSNDAEPIRMYPNKVYDCDTCNGKDNEGGNTVPYSVNPETDTRYYAGRGSILWNNIRKCADQTMAVDASGNTVTLKGIVAIMRNLPSVDAIGGSPFSPEGAAYYFVKERIEKWPVVVTSYDCEKKYIDYSNVTGTSYYALQGSGRLSLPAFIEERWRIRDGYYQTGAFKSQQHMVNCRMGAKEDAVIKITAAKPGYFGIGNDSGNSTQGFFLQAGESATFDTFTHGDNVALYLYNADLMREIDLSQVSVDTAFFSAMPLLEKILLGGEDHNDWKTTIGSYAPVSVLSLGDLPFLKELDVRQTEVTSIGASQCPRLEKVYAANTSLATIDVAETSPVNFLQMPATITGLSLVNLPKLTYPGGLTLAGYTNMARLRIENCPNVDAVSLLSSCADLGNLTAVRVTDLDVMGAATALENVKASGAVGIGDNGSDIAESGKCSGITGTWVLNDLKAIGFDSLAAYFPNLDLYNSQFGMFVIDDSVTDGQGGITNPDNQTGSGYTATYVPSAHLTKINSQCHAYRGKLGTDGKMHLRQLDDTDYTKFADDGSTCDLTDAAGSGYDFFKEIRWWYKGVNDFKNQKKYYIVSSNGPTAEPKSTARKVTRKALRDCSPQNEKSILVGSQEVGKTVALSTDASYVVGTIDVEGMKQVRWPGVNSGTIGAAFTDENGAVISTYNMVVGTDGFDFVAGEYIFCDVPAGAKQFWFTAPTGFNDKEVIAVDSSHVEAIEPDWVWIGKKGDSDWRRLVGIFPMSLDSAVRPRSISGVATFRPTSSVNADQKYGSWTYDANGKVTNASTPSASDMKPNAENMANLSRMRGTGYRGVSYEDSKDVANIFFGLTGVKDSSNYTGGLHRYDVDTGINDGQGNTTSHGSDTKATVFGIISMYSALMEFNDNAAINTTSFKALRVSGYNDSGAVCDGVWHIWDDATQTERTVQGLVYADSTYNRAVTRVKFGRYADIIPSAQAAGGSWNTRYGDFYTYSSSLKNIIPRRGARIVGNNAIASSGLVASYALAVGARVYLGGDYDCFGGRLAFEGTTAIDTE